MRPNALTINRNHVLRSPEIVQVVADNLERSVHGFRKVCLVKFAESLVFLALLPEQVAKENVVRPVKAASMSDLWYCLLNPAPVNKVEGELRLNRIVIWLK